jgi:glycosyltransferase involved in cell wall biosynthesis
LLFNRDIELATIPWCFDIPTNKSVKNNEKIVTIGGLQPIKGIYDALDAMEILYKKGKSNITLNWIGNDTHLAPNHQKMSEYLKNKYIHCWAKNFIWKGELPYNEAQKLLSESNIVLIPAYFETFNYIALEAASLKKPIIITKGTGASFLFTHQKNAWIVEQNSPILIAKAIIQLYSNPDLCKKLGENAYQLMNTKFLSEIIINERLDIYNKAIHLRKNIDTDNSFLILKKYKTNGRKLYFSLRKKIKKIVKGL